MASDDPFSFLDGAPSDDEDLSENENGDNVPMTVDSPPAAAQATSAEQISDAKRRRTDAEDGGAHAAKKVRVDGDAPVAATAPEPVVVDEFEAEAKREVEASAGLTGAADAGPGSKLELRHQVRR
jgi:ATP-dependent RNA helicase DOB1